jgi:hypothetical protein
LCRCAEILWSTCLLTKFPHSSALLVCCNNLCNSFGCPAVPYSTSPDFPCNHTFNVGSCLTGSRLNLAKITAAYRRPKGHQSSLCWLNDARAMSTMNRSPERSHRSSESAVAPKRRLINIIFQAVIWNKAPVCWGHFLDFGIRISGLVASCSSNIYCLSISKAPIPDSGASLVMNTDLPTFLLGKG